MKRWHAVPLSGLLFLVSIAEVSAEPVIVVNSRSTIERIGQDDAVNIFLGRYRKLSNGETAAPIDQPDGSHTKSVFYRRLVNKDVNEIKAYWSRLVFSGKTTPPRSATSTQEVTKLLTISMNAISYMERDLVDARFRVVMEFTP